jgi:hypothetical protein
MEMPPLPDTTILLVEVGPAAHGIGIDGGEDRDELGVVVERPEQVIGLDEGGFGTVTQRTQPEGARSGPGDVDRTLHSLRRFVRLAAAGNPSILMAFWAPVEAITPEGWELRALGEAFIGRHVIPRYHGSMQSQAMRLMGLSRSGRGGGRDDLIAAHGYDTRDAMHCARLGFQCLELLGTGRLHLPVQGEPAEWLQAVRHGRVPFDDWWNRSLDLAARIEALQDDRSVPPAPDRARIDAWLVATHRNVWDRLEAAA